MKLFILFLIVLISPIELRRHNDDDDDAYEPDDLLSDKYNRLRNRLSQQYRVDDQEDDQSYLLPYEHKKQNPSHKKVLHDNDDVVQESDSDDRTTKSTTKAANEDDSSNAAVCVDKYVIKTEQLVKVKELTNGAHMIRYVLIDKRTLPHDVKVRDSCMMDCCAEKTCDLAMLSEQPTHEGYKCYLFACNGSCILASHQDYTVMMPSMDSAKAKTTIMSTSTVSDIQPASNGSFFRETSVVIFLVFGVTCTIVLFILLFRHCRDSRKRGRRMKNYSVDEDYLINGLYL